jgi:hypothetical protein
MQIWASTCNHVAGPALAPRFVGQCTRLMQTCFMVVHCCHKQSIILRTLFCARVLQGPQACEQGGSGGGLVHPHRHSQALQAST